MSLKNQIARKKVLDTAIMLEREKLTLFTSGNLSMVVDPESEIKTIAVTPTGAIYDKLTPEDIPIVNMAGELIEGELKPSSELLMHLEIYKARSDVLAIVHTHSEYCSAFALAGKTLKAQSEDMVGDIGHDVECSPYAASGSMDLAQNVKNGLGLDKKALLMKNHGLVTAAATLEEAAKIAFVCEKSSKITLLSKLLD